MDIEPCDLSSFAVEFNIYATHEAKVYYLAHFNFSTIEHHAIFALFVLKHGFIVPLSNTWAVNRNGLFCSAV